MISFEAVRIWMGESMFGFFFFLLSSFLSFSFWVAFDYRTSREYNEFLAPFVFLLFYFSFLSRFTYPHLRPSRRAHRH